MPAIIPMANTPMAIEATTSRDLILSSHRSLKTLRQLGLIIGYCVGQGLNLADSNILPHVLMAGCVQDILQGGGMCNQMVEILLIKSDNFKMIF